MLSPYPAPDERDAACARLSDLLGAERVTFGRSAGGRPLLALRVPATGPAAPRVFCSAALHGLELVGTRVALGLLEAMVREEGPAAELRRRAEVWVAPCLNPDGYARTVAQDGRGSLAELRTNANGVDLNRNFPLPRGAAPGRLPWTGSSRPGSATYRGPAPLSEPETAAVDALFARCGFHAAVSVHALMGRLIPARVTDREAYGTYAALCRAFSAAQPRWRYPRLASRRLDAFMGELEDHAHHAHRAWALTVEVFPVWECVKQNAWGTSRFRRFNPRDPEAYVANDVPGIVAYFRAALDRARPGAAP